MEMIDVSTEQLNIILNILKQHVPEYEVRAFGSRYKWTAKDYSDLDLAVVSETKLDWKIISNLKEAFEESNLPFRVDVLDWHAISPEFRALIETGFEVIQKPMPVRDRTLTEGLDMRDKGWQTVKLKDCCTKIGSGATPRGGKEAYLDEGPFALIRSQNVLDFFFSYNGLAFIDKDQANQLSNVEIEEKDVLLNITGDSVARVCQVPNALLPARVNQHVSIIRPDKSKLVPEFLKYILLNPKFKNYMLGLASVGGTRNALTKGMIEDFEINLPDLPIQTRIASILSALDDKIELNRQTNHTLEAIAQAIFKEWFVDFNFPHSPLEGWQAKPDGVESFLRPCPTGGVNSLQAKPATPPSWQKNSLFPFWSLPKNHKLKERAKELRKQGILSEVVFWKAFKDKKRLGWDIDRQVIIGNFIVDFFIPELGLVFEIDGSSHNDKQEYDQERDTFLSSLQLKVVRISDKDVLRNIEGVWSFVTESIKDRVEELGAKSPPRPLGTPQEGNNPPRQASPATPQEGKKCEMQDSKLGPIPKGWRVGRLGEEGDFKNGINYSRDDNGDSEFAIVNVRNIVENKFLDKQTLAPIHIDKKKALPYILEADDILIVRSASPGESAILLQTERNIIYSGFTIRYRLNNKKYFLYLFYIFQNLKQSLDNLSNGTTLKNINQEMLRPYQIILPDEQTISAFNNIVESIFDEIQNINHQSATLAAIRDALLPKLMNGEIEV